MINICCQNIDISKNVQNVNVKSDLSFSQRESLSTIIYPIIVHVLIQPKSTHTHTHTRLEREREWYIFHFIYLDNIPGSQLNKFQIIFIAELNQI